MHYRQKGKDMSDRKPSIIDRIRSFCRFKVYDLGIFLASRALYGNVNPAEFSLLDIVSFVAVERQDAIASGLVE
jgi:hypothetical protein